MGSRPITRTVVAAVLVMGLQRFACPAVQSAPFDPDSDPSRIRWTEIAKTLGPAPDVRGQRFGGVMKTQTNEYWRQMAVGYRRRAAADGIKLDLQAAQDETDQLRQLSIMQTMVGSRYKALLISPISPSNLQPAIEMALAAKLPVVEMDGAVSDSSKHFVGPVNRTMGVQVAQWFIRSYPSGGKVAIIEGQAGVFSTLRRSAGFRDTLLATKVFEIAASVSGQWDRQIAFDATKAILARTPDIIGIYCNNDTMALGAVEAIKSIGAIDRIRVFGSDGTAAAYASIAAGELTGTIDSFPTMVGEIGIDIAERLSVGQPVPRVVETPQVLVTRDNIVRYSGDEEARREALLDTERRGSSPPRP